MTEQYTPTDEDMLMRYVSSRMMGDGVTRTSAEREFQRALAQVKRDAAREAVHGLVARWINEFGASDAYVDMIRDEANDYLSEIYPEETP